MSHIRGMFRRSKSKAPNADPSTTSKSTDNTPFRILDKGKEKHTDPTLNEDIIHLISEHIYFNSYLRPDYKNFSRYALISRAWRDPIQQLLFYEVVIDDVAYKSFSATFSNRKSERTQWLAGCVRVLNFWILETDKASAAKWEARLAPTLNWFPFLYELRLGVRVIKRLNQKTMKALNSTPPIRALQIGTGSNKRGNGVGKSVVPFQILGVTAWKLEFLVICSGTFKVSGYNEFPPVEHQLVEFRWSTPIGVSVDPAITDAITYVTANSLKTLEVLHIPDASHPIVTMVASTLRSLKVTRRDNVPKKLKNLKELILADYKSLPYDGTFFASLPPNITHLGIGCTARDQSGVYRHSLVSAYATLSRLPIEALDPELPSKLQTLSLYIGFPVYSATKFYREDFELKSSSVHVRIFAQGVSSIVGMRSDLVRSTSFPRDVSIRNGRRMHHVNDTGELSTEVP